MHQDNPQQTNYIADVLINTLRERPHRNENKANLKGAIKMDKALKKDLDFMAEVLDEFVEKYKDRLGENGYLTLYHMKGNIGIDSSVECKNRIKYYRKKQ